MGNLIFLGVVKACIIWTNHEGKRWFIFYLCASNPVVVRRHWDVRMNIGVTACPTTATTPNENKKIGSMYVMLNPVEHHEIVWKIRSYNHNFGVTTQWGLKYKHKYTCTHTHIYICVYTCQKALRLFLPFWDIMQATSISNSYVQERFPWCQWFILLSHHFSSWVFRRWC